MQYCQVHRSVRAEMMPAMHLPTHVAHELQQSSCITSLLGNARIEEQPGSQRGQGQAWTFCTTRAHTTEAQMNNTKQNGPLPGKAPARSMPYSHLPQTAQTCTLNAGIWLLCSKCCSPGSQLRHMLCDGEACKRPTRRARVLQTPDCKLLGIEFLYALLAQPRRCLERSLL